MNWSWIGGHDPIFQKLCSFPLPLFGTNHGGGGPKTMSTTKIQNKSEKVCWPHLRHFLCRTPTKSLLKKLWKPPQNIGFEAVFGPSGETRTPGILLPKQARYQLRYTRLWSFPTVVKYGVSAGFWPVPGEGQNSVSLSVPEFSGILEKCGSNSGRTLPND